MVMGKHLQLELFKTKHYQPQSLNRKRNRTNFFGFIRLYEKAISAVIVCVIVSLISFSLGVEKGKTLAVHINKQGSELTEQTSPAQDKIQPGKSKATKILLANESEAKKEDISKFTVQVATFKTKAYAQKEAKRLEDKGVKALIIPKGNYVIVCVGDFSDKHEAKAIVNKMRETYHDCFIRRL